MRRSLFVATLVAVVALAQGQAFADGSGQTRTYSPQSNPRVDVITGVVSCTGLGLVDTGGDDAELAPNTLVFRPGSRSRSVSISVADKSGTTLVADAWQGDRFMGEFCGSTSKPLTLHGTKPVAVVLYDGITTTGPSVVTTGTVTATFAR